MRLTSCADTSFGAAAPGTSTAPIKRSAPRTCCSTALRVDSTVRSARPKRRAGARNRPSSCPSTHISAPSPRATSIA
ncbi:MAG TPA: hypothetical protein VNF69_13045 [Burkholderiales bacterium]|nr:hypothetical protein [Burkholderiales bacterium]